MNMAYVAHRRDYMATAYVPRYHPQSLPQDPPAAMTSQARRARPSSLTEPFITHDKGHEPKYPATAYPFAGYSVVRRVSIPPNEL